MAINMVDQSFVYLSVLRSSREEHFLLHKEMKSGEQGYDVIGDILLHPTQRSKGKLRALLTAKVDDDSRLWIQDLLESKEKWPLLFLRARDKSAVGRLGPEFFSESRKITLPNLLTIEGPLVPEDERKGYGFQLYTYRVGPVSRILRDVLIQREGREPSMELSGEISRK